MINYYLLTKPGIVLGNLITVAAGFWIASKGIGDLQLFFQTMLGLAFIIAAACVFNNYLDRDLDRKMARTSRRALAAGLIPVKNALLLATLLAIGGNLILWSTTSLLTLAVADFGLFVYVLPYSLWKRHTIYGTAIGSVAGAIPPLVGYTAVSGKLDAGAWILFLVMLLWQMPHFYAIALYRLEDYAAAGLPLLPLEKGLFRTQVHMTLYVAAFIPAALLLTYYGYTGSLFAWTALILGAIWLIYSLKGFSQENYTLWGKIMFILSLVTLMGLYLVIPFSV